MKRDMDLIREILLEKEAEHTHMHLPHCSSQQEFAYHVALLKEAGLVEAIVRTDHKGMPEAASIIRLTWTGHEFLDAARNDSVWKNAKDKIIKAGGSWTFSILGDILKEVAKNHILGP
jgi:hypothetical protein